MKARVAELMEQAMSFDSRLASWPSTVPESWQYKPFAPLEYNPDDPGRAYHGPSMNITTCGCAVRGTITA